MDWVKLREVLDAAEAKLKVVSILATELTMSKVFDSYNTAESVADPEAKKSKEKKPRDQAVDKGQLELTKECEECGARLKDAKKSCSVRVRACTLCMQGTSLLLQQHLPGLVRPLCCMQGKD